VNHRSPWCVLFLIAVAALSAAPLAAQPIPADRVRLAHRLEQIARLTLAGAGESADGAIERAHVLLDRASELNPDDAERWLLVAEAAQATDRPDAARQALREYLRLRPSDDVAQLRMIDQLVADKQTVEDRLDFYQRIIDGPAARSFSSALRSRVALRAAVLNAEQGDRDAYTQLLGQALQLDPTNHDAALESFRVISSKTDSKLSDRAAALFTLFMADPSDAATHAIIADMQFTRGFYAGAVDWYVTAERAQAARGGSIDAALVHNWAMALWGSGQSAAAMQLLGYLDPPKPEDAPEDQPAPSAALETLMLRCVIAATGKGEMNLDDHFKALSDAFDRAAAEADDDAELRSGRIWAHLLCDRAIADVQPLIAQVDDDATKPLLTGWLAMRQGETEEAAKQLEPLAETDPRARLGLGLLAEQQGEADQAVDHYTQVYRAVPNDIFGLTAVAQMRKLSASPPVAADVRKLANLFAAVPPELRNMAAEPMKFIQLRLTADPLRYEYGQPITAVLELRNVSNYPLALGPDGTIPTRVLLLPQVRINRQAGPQVAPIVLDIHRTLSLGPRRSLSVPVRLDVTSVAQMLEVYPTANVGITVTAVLNPRIARNGRFEPGRLGSAAQLRSVVRQATPPAPPFIESMIGQLSDTDPALVADALGMLIPLSQQLPAEPVETAELADRAADAVNNVFDDLSAVQKAWAVTLVRQDQAVTRQPYAPLLEAAGRSESDLVHLALLATQVDRVDAPLLNAALRRPDRHDPVRRFAEHLRDALQQRDETVETEE